MGKFMNVGIWGRPASALFGFAACSLMAGPAWSVQPEQSYLGLAFGASEFSQMSELTSSWPDTSLDTVEESDLAWKLYTGHQFSNWLAVETGWVDFGAVRASAVHIGGDSVSMKITPSGFEFSALATASIGDSVQVFARGGALAWRRQTVVNIVPVSVGNIHATGDHHIIADRHMFGRHNLQSGGQQAVASNINAPIAALPIGPCA